MLVATFEEETELKEGKMTRRDEVQHTRSSSFSTILCNKQLCKTKIKLLPTILRFVGIKSFSGPSDPSRGSRVTTKRCSTALVRVRFGLMHAWH